MSDRAWDRKTKQLIEHLHKGAEMETGLPAARTASRARSAAATSAGNAARTWSHGT
ncbi:hypothetical protein ACIOHA_22805 [Streptomyces anulatus]